MNTNVTITTYYSNLCVRACKVVCTDGECPVWSSHDHYSSSSDAYGCRLGVGNSDVCGMQCFCSDVSNKISENDHQTKSKTSKCCSLPLKILLAKIQ